MRDLNGFGAIPASIDRPCDINLEKLMRRFACFAFVSVLSGTVAMSAAAAQSTGPSDLGTAATLVEHKAGGRVLEIRSDAKDGAGTFEAVTETGGVLANVRLSPSGKIQPIPTRDVPNWMLSWRRRLTR